MLSVFATFELLEFDSSGYIKEARRIAEEQMKEGAKQFATVAISQIPVRTGFAAGSFGALADLLGASARFNPIVSFFRKITGKSNNILHKKLKGLQLIKNEYYYANGSKILKNPENAKQFATKPSEIFQWIGGTLTFNFEVDISYFNISDVRQSRSPTSPWRSFELGKEAMINFIAEDTFNKLPKLGKFLRKRIMKVG